MSLLTAFHVGSTALVAQSLRLNTVASNLANAESTTSADGRPYRGKQVVFESVPFDGNAASGVRVSDVVDNPAPFKRVFRPGHPTADENGYVDMPNVDPVEEMVNMISAARAYQMNVESMTVSRQLMLNTLDMGR